MALIQILVSLMPLLREFFKGKQLDDEDDTEKKANKHFLVTLVDKVQGSRKAIIALIIALALSLFINYKAISKLIVMSREERGQSTYSAKNVVKHNPQPTIPRNSEDDDVVSKTVESLQEIYGE